MTAPFGDGLDIRPDIERTPWTDADLATAPHGKLASIGLLRHATSQGRAAAVMVVRLEDGSPVLVQVTWRLLHNAVRALAAGPVGSEED